MRCQAGHQYAYKRNASRHPHLLCPGKQIKVGNVSWDGKPKKDPCLHHWFGNCFKKTKQIRKSKLAGTNVFSETHRSDTLVLVLYITFLVSLSAYPVQTLRAQNILEWILAWFHILLLVQAQASRDKAKNTVWLWKKKKTDHDTGNGRKA